MTDKVITFASMKYIVLICSIYLLAIALFPCNDALAKDSNTPTGKETTKNTSHNTTSQDYCSPFCTCTCCNVTFNFSHQLAGFDALRPPMLTTEKISIRDFNFISSYFGNIWQPPKLNS